MILGIYGYGGHGLEVEELARVINLKENRWEKVIFIDDAPDKTDGERIFSFETIVNDYEPEDIEFMVGIGEPVIRAKIFDKVKEKEYNFTTLIHPSAFVASGVEVREGSMIGYNAYVSVKVHLSENVLIQPMAVLGHECSIGRNSVVSSFVSMSGNSYLGNNSYVGINVCVKQGMKIGNDSVIGLGSAVVHDIPDGVLAVGYPARPIKNENVRAFS